MNHQAQALAERVRVAAAVRSPVVAVAGGRAGAGATTLVAALALGLARRGLAPLVVDRSGDPGDVALRLGLAPRARTGDERPLPAGERVLVLRAPAGEWGPARLRRRLAEVSPGPRGLVLIDCEGEGAAELLAEADQALVVASPDPTTLAGAYGLLKRMAARGSLRHAALVVNRAAGPEEAARLARSLSELTRRFVGQELEAWGGLPHEAARIAARLEATLFAGAAGGRVA